MYPFIRKGEYYSHNYTSKWAWPVQKTLTKGQSLNRGTHLLAVWVSEEIGKHIIFFCTALGFRRDTFVGTTSDIKTSEFSNFVKLMFELIETKVNWLTPSKGIHTP